MTGCVGRLGRLVVAFAWVLAVLSLRNSVWNSLLVYNVDINGVQCRRGDAIGSKGAWEKF